MGLIKRKIIDEGQWWLTIDRRQRRRQRRSRRRRRRRLDDMIIFFSALASTTDSYECRAKYIVQCSSLPGLIQPFILLFHGCTMSLPQIILPVLTCIRMTDGLGDPVTWRAARLRILRRLFFRDCLPHRRPVVDCSWRFLRRRCWQGRWHYLHRRGFGHRDPAGGR